MHCVVYIDDLLLLHQDKEKLREFSATVLVLLESLGFLINYPKSVLEPTQNLVFLGFTINSGGKGTESSCREVRENCDGSQDNVEVPYSLSPVTCPAHREDDTGYPGSPPSSFALPRSAAPQASGLEEEGLQWTSDIVTRSSQGPALVGGKPSHLEWESSSRDDHRCGDRDRCLKDGLGSFLPGNPDRRLLECSGSRTTHQFPRNVSSILCNQSLHQGSLGNLSFSSSRPSNSGTHHPIMAHTVMVPSLK